MPVDTGIILIRHGETEWNKEEIFRGRSDIPLNKNGLAQAAAMAESLKGLEL
jgi:broad specificity phosphatase PhoE